MEKNTTDETSIIRNLISEFDDELKKQQDEVKVLLQKLRKPMTLENRDLLIQEIRQKAKFAEQRTNEIMTILQQYDLSQR